MLNGEKTCINTKTHFDPTQKTLSESKLIIRFDTLIAILNFLQFVTLFFQEKKENTPYVPQCKAQMLQEIKRVEKWDSGLSLGPNFTKVRIQGTRNLRIMNLYAFLEMEKNEQSKDLFE